MDEKRRRFSPGINGVSPRISKLIDNTFDIGILMSWRDLTDYRGKIVFIIS